ncbi:MAG: UPF0158 family protein [Bacteroidales bacterium]
MNLTNREWKELAENVHLGGYEYYIHKSNQSIVEVPSEELLAFDDTLDLEEIRRDFEDKNEMFERILPMDTESEFEIMEDFVEQLPDCIEKDKLEDSLKGRYAFREFKGILKKMDGLMVKWTDFKKGKEVFWVKSQIDNIFEPEEDLL